MSRSWPSGAPCGSTPASTPAGPRRSSTGCLTSGRARGRLAAGTRARGRLAAGTRARGRLAAGTRARPAVRSAAGRGPGRPRARVTGTAGHPGQRHPGAAGRRVQLREPFRRPVPTALSRHRCPPGFRTRRHTGYQEGGCPGLTLVLGARRTEPDRDDVKVSRIGPGRCHIAPGGDRQDQGRPGTSEPQVTSGTPGAVLRDRECRRLPAGGGFWDDCENRRPR